MRALAGALRWLRQASPGGGRRVHGPLIALATFAPTFLAVVLGIPYLAGLPTAGRVPATREANTPPAVSSPAPVVGDLVERAGSTTRPAATLTTPGLGPVEQPAQLPSMPKEDAAVAAVPATPSAIPRPELRSTLPQVTRKAAAPKRSASVVPKGSAWVRAAALADRRRAEHLAALIEREGYPAKVRREGTPSAPWVVWISKEPRRATTADRRK